MVETQRGLRTNPQGLQGNTLSSQIVQIFITLAISKCYQVGVTTFFR